MAETTPRTQAHETSRRPTAAPPFANVASTATAAPRDGRVPGRWLRTQERTVRAPLRRAGVLASLAGALVVPQAWFLAHALAPVVTAQAALADVLPWLWPVPFLVIARFLLGQAADRSALAGAHTVKHHVRDALVRKLLQLGPVHAREQGAGELATTVIDGVEALQPYFLRYVPNLAALAVVPLVIAACVLPRDWISGVVLLVTAPAIPVFMLLIGQGTERLNRRQWRTLARLSGRLLDALQRLTTLKLFNAAEREAAALARVANDYRRATMAVLRVAFLSSLALEFFATVGIALVAVLVGFRLLDGAMGLEAGLFALLLAPEFYAPLRRLGTDYHARMEAIAAAERIVDVLEAPLPPQGRARPPLPERIAIRCDGVDFAYEPAEPVLRGASLELTAGTTTALVGHSGAGKSTLLSLLVGERRPARGRVLVAGHDLADLDPAFWLRHVAVVPQRPHLFAGSIGDNIRLGRPDAPAHAVEAAARAAAAHAFIEALPQGYATPVGEHGQTLSGGQAQRIALARAFLKDAPVLFIDEGTASLDAGTEAEVTAALARLVRERTVLVIAHRLRTVWNAHRVAVMEAGRIVEQGPPAALAASDSRFARMVRDAEVSPWAAI